MSGALDTTGQHRVGVVSTSCRFGPAHAPGAADYPDPHRYPRISGRGGLQTGPLVKGSVDRTTWNPASAKRRKAASACSV